ncbi:MAG: cupredoxin family copper-binding protein [Candidatus Saccharimonadales bacterium]
MKKNTIIGIIIVAIIAVVAFVVIMSKGNTSSSNQAVSTSNTVEIKSYAFNPTPIKVKVGTKVTWTNKDAVAHTVTSDDSSADTFKSDSINQNDTYSYTFTKAGTFTYHCTPHPSMHGTVEVVN